MNSRHLAVDGLWLCLCPRFLTPPVRHPLTARFKRATSTLRTTIDGTTPLRRRSLMYDGCARRNRRGSTLAAAHYLEPSADDQGLNHNADKNNETMKVHTKHDYIRENPEWTVSASITTFESFAPGSPIRAFSGSDELSRAPTAELYVLMRTCANRGLKKEVDYIAKILILDRKEKPNLKLYGSLIVSNVDAATGSAEEAAVLINELSNHGLVADSAIYHSLLRVLAVHPHAVLRGQVRQDMRNSWLTTTESGRHDLIAGYVKEGQTELALDCLWETQRANIRVEAWLYQMIIYKLCEIKEVEEALMLLKHMISTGVTNMSSSVWYFVFDKACDAIHYDAIQFIWNRRVELNHLTPSVPQCTHALVAAARNCDAQLANDVFRALTRRSAVLDSQHYEALMEAYVGVDDLRTALTVLSIMSRSGVNPSMRSTWPIYLYLRNKAERTRETLGILQDLRNDGRDIPVVAINCLLDASTGQIPIEEIVEQYKMLHKLCSRGPNIDTFNILFRACRIADRKDMAMFLASEMVHLGIKPDALTYDRLTLVCLTDGSLEDAYRYYQEMRSAGMMARGGTFSKMIEILVEARDERAWGILDTMREIYPGAASRVAAWINTTWRMESQEDSFEPHDQPVDISN